MTWAALILASGSLFASSFATTVPQLIVLQGVLFGLGAGVTCPSALPRLAESADAPVIMYLAECALAVVVSG